MLDQYHVFRMMDLGYMFLFRAKKFKQSFRHQPENASMVANTSSRGVQGKPKTGYCNVRHREIYAASMWRQEF